MRRVVGLVIALFLAVGLLPVHARAAPGPEDAVRNLYGTLLDTMRRGPHLGERGRYEVLAPAIHRDFDLTAMTRLAIGPSWTRLTLAQQQSVTDAFARYTIATYADRFASYSGERLEVTGVETGGFGTIVRSRIVRSNGDLVTLNYLMRQDGDDWQIVDVYLSGTVSQVATLRSQFSAVLARQGVAGLVDTLNRKAAVLVANAS